MREEGVDEDEMVLFLSFDVFDYLKQIFPFLTMVQAKEKELDPTHDSDYQKTHHINSYDDVISQIEFHIISDSVDYIESRGFSKLSSEDLNELRKIAEKTLENWVNFKEVIQIHIARTKKLLTHLETPI